ncbi:hypothetical protein AAIA72_01380 [Hahella sp. SMD15-11]|uniref:Uncharacterized protein n=1 Tax=Thermohahella caldifontis TaxID=3142973 RepID=A0AB39UXC0_9GAMM
MSNIFSRALCLILALATTGVLHAEISKDKARRSITAIKAAFEEAQHKESIWKWSWVGIYGASMLGNIAFAESTDNKAARYDARVSATTSALGLAGMLLEKSIYAEGLKTATRKLKYPKERNLAKVENLLIEAGRTEALYAHTHRKAGLAVSFAAGLVIALDDGRPEDGAIQFVTGALVNELRLRTHPHTLTRFWRSYTPRTVAPMLSEMQWQLVPHHTKEGIDGGRLVAYLRF